MKETIWWRSRNTALTPGSRVLLCNLFGLLIWHASGGNLVGILTRVSTELAYRLVNPSQLQS
eukprot:1144234-Pelagomonas_calceolata.AAC.6